MTILSTCLALKLSHPSWRPKSQSLNRVKRTGPLCDQSINQRWNWNSRPSNNQKRKSMIRHCSRHHETISSQLSQGGILWRQHTSTWPSNSTTRSKPFSSVSWSRGTIDRWTSGVSYKITYTFSGWASLSNPIRKAWVTLPPTFRHLITTIYLKMRNCRVTHIFSE